MARQIVVVDDDPLFRSLLTELAEASGLDVVAEASSLEDAELALASNPDMVLLDLHLPDGTGLDVVARVRRITKSPITVLTGDDTVDVESLLAAGAVRVLQKAEIDLDSFDSLFEDDEAYATTTS